MKNLLESTCNFKNSLKQITLVSCIAEENTESGIENLNNFLKSFPNLTDFTLEGMKIGENLVLFDSFNKAISLRIPLNGLYPEVC